MSYFGEPVTQRPVSEAESMTATPKMDLNGRRVLVVEDEALVSMLLEDMLIDLGCTVLGPLMRIRDALNFIAESGPQIDIAILDVNIAGEVSFSVAEALQALGKPFVLSTGYDDGGIDLRWRDRPILRKPYLASQLEAVLGQALADGG